MVRGWQLRRFPAALPAQAKLQRTFGAQKPILLHYHPAPVTC
jgi:hypothetical protein